MPKRLGLQMLLKLALDVRRQQLGIGWASSRGGWGYPPPPLSNASLGGGAPRWVPQLWVVSWKFLIPPAPSPALLISPHGWMVGWWSGTVGATTLFPPLPLTPPHTYQPAHLLSLHGNPIPPWGSQWMDNQPTYPRMEASLRKS